MQLQFEDILSHNSTVSKSQKVLAVVTEFSFRTSRELAAKVPPSILDAEVMHKRLADLLKKGLVRKGPARICTVTGKRAATWYAPLSLGGGL